LEWQPSSRNSFQQYCCGSANIDVFDLQGASSINPAQQYLMTLPQQSGGACSFQQQGSNCGVCDLSSASVDGWFLMAGGQYSLNATDPLKACFVLMPKQPRASYFPFFPSLLLSG
jgi:hypothetical protein